MPFLLGAFGPPAGALVIRIRRRRRGEPVPEHAVRFRPAALLLAPLLMLAASAAVLAAAVIGHAAGDPAPSWSDAQDTMRTPHRTQRTPAPRVRTATHSGQQVTGAVGRVEARSVDAAARDRHEGHGFVGEGGPVPMKGCQVMPVEG